MFCKQGVQKYAIFAWSLTPALLLWAGADCALVAQEIAPSDAPRQGAPRVYIVPQDGFESNLAAAIIKKHVPAVVTQNKDEAQFILSGTLKLHEESAGSKVARCLFAYCAGMEGVQAAAVQLVNARTQEVVWAYNVHKPSAKAYQSTAEAVAKHLKQFLEEHPQ
jgi:hypothetical protein